MPLLRRFRDSRTAACAYLIGSDTTHQAVFIDPVLDQLPLYLGVLEELDYRLACVLETHLHADHMTAADRLREMTGALIACSRESGVEGADLLLDDGEVIAFGQLAFEAIATPGHSPACLTYLCGDRLFTGDTLLIGDCGRTDEPGGLAGRLFDSIGRRLLVLPDEYLIYPGHGSEGRWVSCIGEEKRSNALLAGIGRDEFIALNRRRQAPLPSAMDDNLAANRRCGRRPAADPDSLSREEP